ncbi:MAG: thymidine phosphorylase [Pirellulales bacterium]
MIPAALIAKKRDGGELTSEEIAEFVAGYMTGSVADYQMSAWAMAVVLRGMTPSEIAALTSAMLHSGRALERCTSKPRVDKHSTGGLGDKTSLIIAPLLACLDLDVPMLSGRGLGITGGTLDKLEAFPGYRCDLTEEEIDRQLASVGCVITGTTQNITPADRRLYALRDVTGTVESVALITASIMSKKLAESLDALVLDVKFGGAAFMQRLDDARELAGSLMRTGSAANVPTRALLTDMNQPLGRMVGNACEVNEALDMLRGEAPADLREVTLRLCAEVLLALGRSSSIAEAILQLETELASGRPLDRFRQMVESQAGRFADCLPTAPAAALTAARSGYVRQLHGRSLGQAVVELGGGRKQLGEAIDPSVGLEMLVRVGDRVDAGQEWIKVFSPPGARKDAAVRLLQKSIVIEDVPPEPLPLILEMS